LCEQRDRGRGLQKLQPRRVEKDGLPKGNAPGQGERKGAAANWSKTSMNHSLEVMNI